MRPRLGSPEELNLRLGAKDHQVFRQAGEGMLAEQVDNSHATAGISLQGGHAMACLAAGLIFKGAGGTIHRTRYWHAHGHSQRRISGLRAIAGFLENVAHHLIPLCSAWPGLPVSCGTASPSDRGPAPCAARE